ncbi:MAG TPA: aromatic amino acid lyase, partial [Skermanella sp.]|nr:aromatic amino acid lyase [Skermanella sp.]
MSELLRIQPARLTLPILRRIARSPDLPVALEYGWEKPVEAAAATVADVIARGDAAYGINTGFGLLARKRIPNHSLRELQTRLVLSHAAGTGAPLSAATVRLILVLKAASLARGHSGVRPIV